LPQEYERTGQKATYIQLSPEEYKTQLLKKINEEVNEIHISDSIEDITNEIADVQQALTDLMAAFGIAPEKVTYTGQVRNNLKGGFKSGYFVETLELADDDPWVEYYRKSPDIFPEIK
jgi:predicted house-cleaning noncanonical NTP pyrophosphatase (MazG superfamily)